MSEIEATSQHERNGRQDSLAVLLLDRSGVIRSASRSAGAALGRTVERVVGRPLHEIVPGIKAQVYPWIDSLAGADRAPPPRVLELEVDCAGQVRNFDGILYALCVGAAAPADQPVAGLKLRPSSMLLARTQALDAQQTLLEQIARGATLRDTLREVARFAERQMSAETFCAIVTTDERLEGLERAVVAGLPRDVAQPYAVGSMAAAPCPAAVAIASQLPVIATDLDARSTWRDFADGIRRHGLRAVWSYPVKPGAGSRRAALDFLLTAPREPNSAESRIAEQMTALVGLALDLDHVRAELAARTANLASIVASLPVVLWETDAHGVLTLIDGGALATVKLHAADVVGRSSEQAFGASDATQLLVRRALKGEAVWADVATLGRIFAIGVAPIRDTSGAVSGMRGLALDITARKEAERALRETVERLHLVIDASNDGFWDFRLEGAGSMASDR
ncbi:MAG: PAS domain-containing protein, partial [Phycisphaerae bacterium]|nr:PAS domain-containing protein [Phycisphaerae bacterium]